MDNLPDGVSLNDTFTPEQPDYADLEGRVQQVLDNLPSIFTTDGEDTWRDIQHKIIDLQAAITQLHDIQAEWLIMHDPQEAE